jgi:hypothetical protein
VHQITVGLCTTQTILGYRFGYSGGMARLRFSFLQPSYVRSIFGELATSSYWHRVDGGALPWPVLVRLGISDGRLVVTGILIGSQDDPPEVTSRQLRRVSIPDVTENIARSAWAGDPHLGAFWRTLIEGTAAPHRLSRRRPGPRGYGRDHYRHVAKRYRQALLRKPRSAMATLAVELRASPSTARRWVATARALGLLGPAPIGRAGEEAGPGD